MNIMQNKIFDIAQTFANLCQKYNLQYFLCGGTVLGAVRHHGFIPWDDDMDFLMPREDYEKFLQIAPKELENTHYALRDFSVDGEGYSFCFSKIDDRTTTLIELSQSNFGSKAGVYIDIFPLDGTFDSKLSQTCHLFIISKLIRLREIAFTARIRKSKPIRNLLIKILQKTCRGKTLHSLISFCLTLKPYRYSNFAGNLVWGYGIKEVMPKDIFGSGRTISFEGTEFTAPNQTDLYLRRLYEDYMTYPPEEERVSQHPVFFMDLDLPYKDYQYDL